MHACSTVYMEIFWNWQKDLPSILCMNNGSSKGMIEGRGDKKKDGVDSL